ncbi:SH3 domain-containing kinase-binding protein 1 [Hondaea fermentalgiana]|uniref:SH3 domain-containing kinase-binding protein 1 n=1 Tax=Hondaea fermentalgiana TaxID=2315210 RepID=A0A2R5G559_9STRA|nr:SH3 domain-containing kinase-binding protein 1 [Hondaea fermentalgiana]|eukprot:GBG26167.1 SH3 domain-containing kinase-binding protein 1 [Hondaea fermentalgiana]
MAMKTSLAVLLAVLALSQGPVEVRGDIYMHNPRGSNNRNCEINNANTGNANRLFDSENNNAGGYNCPRAMPFSCYELVDDATALEECQTTNYNITDEEAKAQLDSDGNVITEGAVNTDRMYYFSGSKIPIEWTVQHGLGPNAELHSQIVIQYACEDTLSDNCGISADSADDVCKSPFYPDSSISSTCSLRDGTPIAIKSLLDTNLNVRAQTTIPTSADAQDDMRYGRHETLNYYQQCLLRERNKGLWTSDQSVSNNKGAMADRQNPNDNRYGLECVEESHYWPYWHWSPWKDVAVLTEDESKCDYFRSESQNVKPRGRCACPSGECTSASSQPNNERACIAEEGTWCTDPSHGIDPPECVVADFNRQNHLGNVGGSTSANRYVWTVPHVDQRTTCVLRVRYNISTADGITAGLEASVDGTAAYNVGDPNPIYDNDANEDKTYIAVNGLSSAASLSYTMNTEQIGRTFQDRSYVFDIVPASEAGDECEDRTIYNLNVRGKRGNIVQTYPAVEYDFVPADLTVTDDDCVHVQWTGSDYNPDRGGNDGEGGPRNALNTGQTTADRSNMVPMVNAGENFAMDDVSSMKMFDISTDQWARLLFLDQEYANPEKCYTFAQLEEKYTSRTDREESFYNCAKLSGAKTPYFDLGAVRTGEVGTYHYMSTRNNNFSNRGQKGHITVVAGGLHPGAIAAIAIASVGFAALLFVGFRRHRRGLPLLPSFRGSSRNLTVASSPSAPASSPRVADAQGPGFVAGMTAGAAAFGSRIFGGGAAGASAGDGYVVASYQHVAQEPGELSFSKGDRIRVINRDTSGWWEGEANGQRGVFPANYVRK